MDGELPPGVYEQLLTRALEHEVEERVTTLERVDAAVAGDRLAVHLGQMIRRAVDSVPESDRILLAETVAARLAEDLQSLVTADLSPDVLTPHMRMLRSIGVVQPDGSVRHYPRPLTPLLDTTLLTNASNQPRLMVQIESEIASADSIDLVIAFIRRSGLNPIRRALAAHCADGGRLRILTTTYTGTTQLDALRDLAELGAQVRVSYDTSETRLHAKAWMFNRASGASTAFIGSSNLTHQAQHTGAEWNLRVSEQRNADVIREVRAVFEIYWASGDFKDFDPVEFADRTRQSRTATLISPVEIHLHPFQQRMLEEIDVSRQLGHHRNLLVSATGTGKTVMAAVWYGRLRQELPRARLLFIGHRKELLTQARDTMRHHLRDATFGELWADGQHPVDFDHVFATIQSLHTLDDLDPRHFDVVIIDEFHHAAADTYRRVLEHLQPVELLGMTATPERSDGQPILHWFGDRIAAELRLWDAIDQRRLSPFSYFGISDGSRLTGVRWIRGTGYDLAGLSEVYTGNHAWVRKVIQEVQSRTDPQFRALGFCVDIAHARFMAAEFSKAGIPAVHVSGRTPAAEREAALADLRSGRLRVVFSVELFNEGVDVPTVDTLLLLRPTESPVLFLQQLGRGLRKADDKTECLVLDFIGQHRVEFRFDRRYRALLGGTRKDLERAVKSGFPYLPAGCHMELDSVASEQVLRNIKEAIPSRWPAKVEELRAMVNAGYSARLDLFLEHSGLEIADIYDGKHTWSSLKAEAGLPAAAEGKHENALRRAVSRLLHVDDPVRLQGYREVLRGQKQGSQLERMLVAALTEKLTDSSSTVRDAMELIRSHRRIVEDLDALFEVLTVDHVQPPLSSHPFVPLRLHARYSRLEILAAFASGPSARTRPWREGTIFLEDQAVDLHVITLDKNPERFSPTTRYRDYAITPELLHWESQSTTPEDGRVGRRYRGVGEPSTQLFFARLDGTRRDFWFLGPAAYVEHTGERPMAITWRLQTPLPGDLFAQFAAAVA